MPLIICKIGQRKGSFPKIILFFTELERKSAGNFLTELNQFVFIKQDLNILNIQRTARWQKIDYFSTWKEGIIR